MQRIKSGLTALAVGIVLLAALDWAAAAATGQSFVLGKWNQADQTTTIKNVGSGPALDIRAKGPAIAIHNANRIKNLNADKLDGKSEEDFLPSRLYGVATGLVNGPGGGKTVLVSGVNLGCDTGDVAISAGGNAVDAEDHLNGIVPFRSSYQIEFTDNGGASRFSANMICADVSKPFR